MDVTISAGFSGRPYDLRMRIYTIENNWAGNYSRYRGDRYAYSRTGNGSYHLDCATCNSWIAGYYGGGCYGLDFRGDFAGKTVGLGSYDTGAVWHDGNGNVFFTSRIQMNIGQFGNADTGDVGMWGDRLGAAPGAPGQPSASNLTPTSLTLSWTAAPRGRADIDAYLWQIDNDANFSSPVMSVQIGNTLSDNTADNGTLSPGNIYYARVAAHNGDGWGPYSSTLQFTTLPATPPGMVVTPGVAGTTASVALTPPGGTTGLTKYTVEYRLLGGGSSSIEGMSPLVANNLLPGETYEWRGSAWFGAYQSPWTDWAQVVQPQPNTNPGSYFDGSTAPRDDLTFEWIGTANNSQSRAMGLTALGWNAGDLPVQRVTGGRSGTYGGRVTFVRDWFEGDGARVICDDPVPVEEGAVYVASLYMRPVRPQRMVLAMSWNGSPPPGEEEVVGPPVIVEDTVGWTRLSVSGRAPAGATGVKWVLYDVDGDGHSMWLSGESFEVDDAMISLASLFPFFSGDTPDTAEFNYEWEGAANASVSARNELSPTSVDLLADPDCPAPPTPPTVPTVPADCIEEIGTWRRYTMQLGETAVRKWTASLPTLVLMTGDTAERQVRIRYYPNPDNLAPELLDMATWEAEQILTYIPPDSVVTLDGVTQLVWAEVAGSDPIPADKLLYGTGGLPAIWPVLSCGSGYVVTLDVPLDAPAGNLSTEIFITQRM